MVEWRVFGNPEASSWWNNLCPQVVQKVLAATGRSLPLKIPFTIPVWPTVINTTKGLSSCTLKKCPTTAEGSITSASVHTVSGISHDSRREQKLHLVVKGPWHCHLYTRRQRQSQQLDLVSVDEIMTIAYMFWRLMEPQPAAGRGAGKAITAKSQWLGCKCSYRLGLGLCHGECFTPYFCLLAKGGESLRWLVVLQASFYHIIKDSTLMYQKLLAP